MSQVFILYFVYYESFVVVIVVCVLFVYGVHVTYMYGLCVHACVQIPGEDIKYPILTLYALYS